MSTLYYSVRRDAPITLIIRLFPQEYVRRLSENEPTQHVLNWVPTDQHAVLITPFNLSTIKGGGVGPHVDDNQISEMAKQWKLYLFECGSFALYCLSRSHDGGDKEPTMQKTQSNKKLPPKASPSSSLGEPGPSSQTSLAVKRKRNTLANTRPPPPKVRAPSGSVSLSYHICEMGIASNVWNVYFKLNMELYTLDPTFFFTPAYPKAINENTVESFKSIMSEPSPGVFFFAMFRPNLCEMMLSEVITTHRPALNSLPCSYISVLLFGKAGRKFQKVV